ncbi:Mevalonate kinase [Blastocladiella emersonii ATCC 22665]|nr:Mevalonate kinase [Blastocladiella emersonii ATCC 22665]
MASAPGKTILFGEHSVVYGKMAIATAVNLRSYALLYPVSQTSSDADAPADHVTIAMPDVALRLSIPCDALQPFVTATAGRGAPRNLEQRDALAALVEEHHQRAHGAKLHETQLAASLAALHLVTAICPLDRVPPLMLLLRSQIPIGSGLGSSASLSVAMAGALLKGFGAIAGGSESSDGGKQAQSPQRSPKRARTTSGSGTSPATTRSNPDTKAALDLINAWALAAERVIHGTPSGVDNTVVTFGGALAYTKGDGMETLTGFDAFEFLLVDSKVQKNTMVQVGKVKARRDAMPAVINPVLDAMDALARAGRQTLIAGSGASEAKGEGAASLNDLIRVNQSLLAAIDVSHPTLEQIIATAAKHGLAAKLTGAGGGGCVLTYLDPALDDAAVPETLRGELEAAGFATFRTQVGGQGVALHALPSIPSTATGSSPTKKRKRGDNELEQSDPAAIARWLTKADADAIGATVGRGGAPCMELHQ